MVLESTSKAPAANICVFASAVGDNNPSDVLLAEQLARSLHERNVHLIYGGGSSGLMGKLAAERVRLGGVACVTGVQCLSVMGEERPGDHRTRLAHLKSEVESGSTSVSKLKKVFRGRGAKSETESNPSNSEKSTVEDQIIDLPPDPTHGQLQVAPSLSARKAHMIRLVNQGGRGSGFIALPGGLGTLDEIAEVLTLRSRGVHGKDVVLVGREGFWDGLMGWINGAVGKGFVSPERQKGVKAVEAPAEAVEWLHRDHSGTTSSNSGQGV